LTNLGLALTLTGKAKEGLVCFQRARHWPTRCTLLKDQGVAHVQLSAFDEAIADFQAAPSSLIPNDPQLHYDLGMAYKFKDRVDDAITELTRAAKWTPAFRTRLHPQAYLYMQIRQTR